MKLLLFGREREYIDRQYFVWYRIYMVQRTFAERKYVCELMKHSRSYWANLHPIQLNGEFPSTLEEQVRGSIEKTHKMREPSIFFFLETRESILTGIDCPLSTWQQIIRGSATHLDTITYWEFKRRTSYDSE